MGDFYFSYYRQWICFCIFRHTSIKRVFIFYCFSFCKSYFNHFFVFCEYNFGNNHIMVSCAVFNIRVLTVRYIHFALTLPVLYIGLSSDLVSASPVDMETTTQSFSVQLGATRVIYDPASNGTTLLAINPQNYPILLQTDVLAEDMKTRAPFMVTPPLMRLDPQEQTRLRIVRTGGEFSADRESLQWLCAKGIPPKADDAWAQDSRNKQAVSKNKVSMNVRLSISNCIKLFVRPKGVKGSPVEAARNVIWRWQSNQLKGTNPSPFYINLNSLKVDGRRVDNAPYIPPFSSHEYAVKGVKAGSQVSWKIINDYGGESPQMQGTVK